MRPAHATESPTAEPRVVDPTNQRVLEHDRQRGKWSVRRCDELRSCNALVYDAEGTVRPAATWSEPSGQSPSRVDEIVNEGAGGPQRSDTDTRVADYPAVASRTAAREVDGHRWLERAGLGLTRLLISGWEVVDLLSGCNRLARFDVVRRLR